MADILDMWGERSNRLSDDMTLLAEGEINPAQMALRSLGETGGAVGDIAAPVVEQGLKLVPDLVKDGFSDVVKGVMETGPAQYALKWMETHPEQARDIVSALNAAQLMPGLQASRGIRSLAHNMPNELQGFYGSGVSGQALAAGKEAPMALAMSMRQAISPQAQARMRQGGVSERLRHVSGKKADVMEKNPMGSKEYKDARGFAEGQMDQSSLLLHGSGHESQFMDDTFRSTQELHTGPLDSDTMKSVFTTYKPDNYTDLPIDDEMVSVMTRRVRDAQEIKPNENVQMVLRHPTSGADLAPEMTSKGGAPGKRMYKARQWEQKLNPGKTKFDSVDEVKEFVATRALVDSDIVRKDGRALTKADRAELKAFGPRKGKYKVKEEGNGNVDAYYKYKQLEREGKLTHKASIKKYEELKKRIAKAKDNVETDSQGRVYTQSSHRSSAKGLGGVNDQYVIDKDGNVFSFINDENDLFGKKVPGDQRVVSVTPPTVYNVFTDRKNASDTLGKAHRENVRGLLAEQGSLDRGAKGLTQQQARAISNYSPKVRASDVASAAGNATNLGLLGGLLYSGEQK